MPNGNTYNTESWRNLDPRLQSAFLAMAAQAPGEIGFTSGWRSHDTQTRLHNQKPGLAAAPGHSNHEFGLAIDMTFENAATRRWVHANARRFGLWFPMDYEPWHVQLVGIDRHNIGGQGGHGGGRDAFSTAPDGRFSNPYDVLGGQMAMEDNTDPLTQFGRLVAAVSSPAGAVEAMASPVANMSAPGMNTPTPDLTEAATTVATDKNFTPTSPFDRPAP